MQCDDVTANRIRRTDAILKIVFGRISAPYCPIKTKFGARKQKIMLTYFT